MLGSIKLLLFSSQFVHTSIPYLFVQWLLLRYAIFNIEVIQAAIKIAKQEGVSVSLDLASFEVTACQP